jgi:chromosomal replication initiator protein
MWASAWLQASGRSVRILVRDIQASIASDFGIPSADFLRRDNHRRFARPRQIAMLLSRELTPLSTVVIGKLFERDHSTVVHGAQAARDSLLLDPVLALKVEARKLLLECGE